MKNLVYTIAINDDNRDVNDVDMVSITSKTWKYWCKKNNIDFYIIDTLSEKDTFPHWARYSIFNLKPDYDRYLYVDADIMIKWDTPNIFETFDDLSKLYAVKDDFSLHWIYEGIKGYQKLFPNVDLQWDKYFNSGVVLFSKEHKELYTDFFNFYKDNKENFNLMKKTLRRGVDQTPFNYFCKMNDVDIEYISPKYNLGQFARRGILQPGYFIDIAYLWHFNGLPKPELCSIMTQIWDHIKEMYNE